MAFEIYEEGFFWNIADHLKYRYVNDIPQINFRFSCGSFLRPCKNYFFKLNVFNWVQILIWNISSLLMI